MQKVNLNPALDEDEGEHELSYYLKDKVKLMKEVLKIIKPKKIKSMAPDCIKNSDIVEINSMLLEELLGISNKRLQYVFKGENVDRETSSSDSDEEIDVISLDDISDDDIVISTDRNEEISASKKIKAEKPSSVKIEKKDKSHKEKIKKSKKTKGPNRNQLMSVLELLELQARARAIRSQLAIENENKEAGTSAKQSIKEDKGSDSDAIIVESPKFNEIVITSSESETESSEKLLVADSNEESRLQKEQDSNNEELVSMPYDDENTVSKQKLLDSEKGSGNSSNLESGKSNSQANIRERRQKFLAKVQKIKLIRNKGESSMVHSKEVLDLNTSENLEEVEAIVDNIEEGCVSKSTCETENVVIKMEKSTKDPTAINAIIPINYCDNDEIVINLDDDEMDGIENG